MNHDETLESFSFVSANKAIQKIVLNVEAFSVAKCSAVMSLSRVMLIFVFVRLDYPLVR